ncbi:helix-turn-helix domain-containing protein [Ferrimonas marina]|uniref:Transcriptional regulator, AraC family n=1 Tax=Ferrimonas marina TaxID=299255 RepID=A0A1M5R4T3_9GAMM|nr:AraC family transcriptional regulator [Ferrimonas marina]SHH20989.1 transcriptional regulator, AraC family [Ferrimonas marina]
MKYQEVYPSAPAVDSNELDSERAAELLTLEYFEAEPNRMPTEAFSQHHILLNLNPDPHRVENWRQGVHRDFTFHQGDVVITPAETESGWRWHARSQVIVITLAPEKLQRFAAQELQLVLAPGQLKDVPCQPDPELVACGQQLITAMGQRLGSELMFESLARVFLTQLLDRYGRVLQRGEQRHFSQAQLQRVLNFLQQHYADKITVEQMAQQAAFSTYHFARAFKRVMGLSPYLYLQQLRIEQAKQKLLTQSDSLLVIAQACGFANQAHFSRVFKQLTGESPSRWQQQQRARSDKN